MRRINWKVKSIQAPKKKNKKSHAWIHLSSMSIDPWMDHSEKRVKIPSLYHAYMVKLMKRKVPSCMEFIFFFFLPSFLLLLLLLLLLLCESVPQTLFLGFNKKGHLSVGISFLQPLTNKLYLPNLLPSYPTPYPHKTPAPQSFTT